MTNKKVCFLIPYFGQWPKWFPAFARSCEKNPRFTYLFFTDLAPPPSPENVEYVRMTHRQLLDLASRKLNVPVRKNVYGLCDLRPAFGLVFEDYIRGYDFWGHVDIDLVWGRLSIFLSEEILDHYDIVSSRRGYLAGHCTVYRNVDRINNLLKEVPNVLEDLSQPNNTHVDEIRMSSFLRRRRDIRVYWHCQHVVDERELVRRPWGWRWENGRILNDWHVERAYVHFFTLKRTLKEIDFCYDDKPEKFVITPRGFFAKTEPGLWDRLRVPPAWWIYRRVYHKAYELATGRRRF